MKILTGAKRRGTRLRNEIFLWVVMLCLAEALIIGVVFFSIHTTILFENEKESLTQLLNVVNQDIESRIEAFNSISLDIVINDGIKDNLNRESSIDIGRAKMQIQDVLSNKILSVSGLLDLSIIDRKGNTYSTRAVYHLPDDFDIEDTYVFKKARSGNGALVWIEKNEILDAYAWDPNFDTSRMNGLRAAAVIKNYSRGEILGLLMLTLKERYFFSIHYSNRKLDGVKMYLVSPDKSLVLPVAGTEKALEKDILSRLDSESGGTAFIIDNDEHSVVSFMYNNAMGWYLVSVTDAAEINRSFAFLVRALLAALIFSAAASMFLAWATTFFMTRDLIALAEKMHQVELGNFDIQVELIRHDEIGWLASAFNNMVRQIKILIDTTYKQELLTRDAEFKALQAQINPHFLYNTLDMINWRLLSAGQHELSSTVIALGRLLRYSISADDCTSLARELENSEDYMVLRQTNKDPQFEYSIDRKGGGELSLPKLTLQPLVENAIIHGFGRRRTGNILRIDAQPTEQGLYRIRVSDNGIGMDEQIRAQILSPYAKTEIGRHTMHIGIKNVDERLKHMYGDEFGLRIESSLGGGTTVIITIPNSFSGGPS